MSKDHVAIPMATVSPNSGRVDMNDIEMVFGSPPSQNPGQVRDIHNIDNERQHARNDNNRRGGGGAHDPLAQPLLEPRLPVPLPPIAGPEIDDIDENKPADNTPFPGIDDGLLEPEGNKTPELHDDDDDATHPVHDSKEHSDSDHHGEGGATDDGNWNELAVHTKHGIDEPDFYGDGFGNGMHNRFGEDRPGSPAGGGTIIPDVNTYQQKKNLAQGMMDLALLSANANQLRYVLESSATHPYFYPSLTLISFSIILQVLVGVGLIMNSRYDVNDNGERCKADKINNMTVLGIFLITIVNVFITSFSVATPMAVTALNAANVAAAPNG